MSNVFTLAKAYAKKHPRTSWQDCIKAVSGKKKARVSGTTRKADKPAMKPVKKKVVKKTTKTEKYTISGFKEWEFDVRTNHGRFTVVAPSAAEARKEAMLLIRRENEHRKLEINPDRRRKPLRLVSIKKITGYKTEHY